MKLAVIKTGGKQYVVTEGQTIRTEKVSAEAGKDIMFKEVLLYADGRTVKVGMPDVSGAQVRGTVEEQGRSKKVTVVKYKSKTRYRRTKGHRQAYTKVSINKISA